MTNSTQHQSTQPSFLPNLLVRHRHVQTVLLTLHRAKPTNVQEAAQEMILETTEGVQLQGYYSPQPEQSKGIVLLLHG
ncbi:MAG: hypothetical protein KDJ65_13105, partial [Anaerolineae bacterium]|nr:hypothetical protein [Anaerolineae bacterium]